VDVSVGAGEPAQPGKGQVVQAAQIQFFRKPIKFDSLAWALIAASSLLYWLLTVLLQG